jgi:hypothetical protein
VPSASGRRGQPALAAEMDDVTTDHQVLHHDIELVSVVADDHRAGQEAVGFDAAPQGAPDRD